MAPEGRRLGVAGVEVGRGRVGRGGQSSFRRRVVGHDGYGKEDGCAPGPRVWREGGLPEEKMGGWPGDDQGMTGL